MIYLRAEEEANTFIFKNYPRTCIVSNKNPKLPTHSVMISNFLKIFFTNF